MVFRAACVQLRSGEDVAENIRQTVTLVREAAARGATFIATPENTTLMAPDGGAKLAQSFDEAQDPAIPVFAALARELKIWLLIGSLAIKVRDDKTANRSFLFSPDGEITARYSKIHLFDVELASGESYRESSVVFYHDEAQKRATESIIQKLTEARVFARPIVTEISPASAFYPAEAEHQDYYRTHEYQPYCQVVIQPKLHKFLQQFPEFAM